MEDVLNRETLEGIDGRAWAEVFVLRGGRKPARIRLKRQLEDLLAVELRSRQVEPRCDSSEQCESPFPEAASRKKVIFVLIKALGNCLSLTRRSTLDQQDQDQGARRRRPLACCPGCRPGPEILGRRSDCAPKEFRFQPATRTWGAVQQRSRISRKRGTSSALCRSAS